MTEVDYTIGYREQLEPKSVARMKPYDVVISAFNLTDRVKWLIETVPAREKHLFVHDEYGLGALPSLTGCREYHSPEPNEADYLQGYFVSMGPIDPGASLALDITGFMRPHLMLLVEMLFDLGFVTFDVLYAAPSRYVQAERTQFARGSVTKVRQVSGYEGAHRPDSGNRDVLIIGTGYDHELIRAAAEFKQSARKIELYGLPALQPDMYQENILRVDEVREALSASRHGGPIFAPAYDPFVTAQELHRRVTEETAGGRLVNLYLCPLGTKPQALGFALYYLHEWRQSACSILYPFSESQSPATSEGISSVWRYRVERFKWYGAPTSHI